MTGEEPLLRMKNIHLYYGNVHALKGVDFGLYPGEIHALVGTHRAGKSSLVKILSGFQQKDEGEIILKGEKIDRFTIKSAFQYGIGMLYQDVQLVRNLSTLGTIYFDQLSGFFNKHKNWEIKQNEVNALLDKYNIKLNFYKSIKQNTLNEQYLVDFLYVLMRKPEILILDELSARFTPEMVEYIYPILFDLKAQGKSIVYITHNMDEIMKLADRVTILYEGRKMGTDRIHNLDERRFIKLAYSHVLSRQELEQANIELYNLKKYNEDILRSIPIGVIILDEKNEIYFSNAVALSIFELEEKDYSEEAIESFLEGKNFEDKKRLLQNIYKQEHCTINESVFSDVILKFILIPFRDENRNFLGTIILIEDITNEIRLMDSLLQSKKVSSIAELAAGVAHEINNPLAIVKNYINLLKMADQEDVSMVRLLKIEKEISRIAGIVRNLLSFSKSSGLTYREMDITSLIKEVLDLLEHKIKENSINLTTQFTVPEAVCICDANKIKQLFFNLIINSIEAVDEGGKIHIELQEDEEEKAWLTTVTDNGPGIPDDILNKIFDPFFSTKENMHNAGLGLSICQHVVELNHGAISCESRPWEKTSFYIKLPQSTVRDAVGNQIAR